MQQPITAYIGLGGNVEDRLSALRQAVQGLSAEPGIRLLGRSAIYETAPLGPEQPDFLNAAVALETWLAPRPLLYACQRIESALGRRPAPERWGPRPIDLDILLYGREIVAEPDLVIPHPELHRRPFALVPLLDLDGALEHPVLGRPLRDLLAELGRPEETRRTEETL